MGEELTIGKFEITSKDIKNFLNKADITSNKLLSELDLTKDKKISEDDFVELVDLIENSKNGFVIPISDSEALYEKINWFLINRDKIEEMSNCAKITAHKYTWNNYYKNYSNTIYEILEKENEKNINY